MLINLSNHPVKNWNVKQISEAEKLFGEITDIPFPQINPETDEAGIENLVDEYFELCIETLHKSKDKNNAVHLMGELTFTFGLVNKLLSEGIVCVASTTERKAIETKGKKITEFEFVRFRKYLK